MAAPSIRGRLTQLAKSGNTTLSTTSPNSIIPTSLSFLRRSLHASVYDRNPEEELVQPSIVPDYVIPPQPEHYWAPDPQTGVFGPPKDCVPAPGGGHVIDGENSVLEQKTFFRSLEDMDKTIQ